MSDLNPDPPSDASFPTTHWSRVVLIGDPAEPEARAALAELCRNYWYPLYAFVRRKGYRAQDAQDLVQGLFARLLERDGLRGLGPARGRFRSYLMACCQNYLANRREHEHAAKRGGGRVPVPIDGPEAEARYRIEPAHGETPERIFERQWARTLLGRAMDRLDAEAARSSRAGLFARLRPALQGDDRAPSYRQVADELGVTEGAVRVAAHRLRARYRVLIREEVARTTGSPDDVEAEIDALLAALAG
jgi:RNA polymerase sigma-70 factor (ECF subfamily)